MLDLERRARRSGIFQAFEHGDFRRAYTEGSSLLHGRMDQALLEVVGVSAARAGQADEACRLLRRALRGAPRRPVLHLAMAEACVQQARLDDAMDRYDRALALEPMFLAAICGKATVLQRRGDNEAAIELLRPFIDARTEDAAMAAAWATAEQSEGRFAGTIDRLQRHIASPATEPAARMALCALIAKAHEKAGDYDLAFEAYAVSNRLMSRPFDPDAYVAEVDELIATFSPANLAWLPRAPIPNERPVFVASMPRSGSTLVEQIIHAHPMAFGAGEITELHDMVRTLPARLGSVQPYPACLGDWTRARAEVLNREYLATLGAVGGSATRVVNKHLDNWRHVGLISLLAPGARVIHCRRHPLDNCFSIFMAAMNTHAYPWSTDLAHIGLVHRQQERVMDHWKKVLDIEILDVEYERVVAAPEPEIRRIIEFLDLPWDESCLRFNEARRDVMTLSYDQVRRPIYRSAVKRYQKYDAHLGPLKAALDG